MIWRGPLSRIPNRFVPPVLAGLTGLLSLAAAAAETPTLGEVFRVGDGVYVWSLAGDPDSGSLWVGTSVGALEVDLAKQTIKHSFTRKDGLASEEVLAVGVARGGAVWFGTRAGGISSYNQGAWRTFLPMHGLADYWVYGFAFDRNSDLWVATLDGASLYHGDSGEFTTYRGQLADNEVNGIDVDGAGRVWFATKNGVSMFDGAAWRSWRHSDGLGGANSTGLPVGVKSEPDGGGGAIEIVGTDSYNPDFVLSVMADQTRQGVWFGTWGAGVSMIDPNGDWRSYGTPDGLAGSVVYSIAREPGGTLWFGTNHGASRFDGETWTSYRNLAAGLDDNIYAIAIDESGDVWLGARGGIAQLTYKK